MVSNLLSITVNGREIFDETTNEFIEVKTQTLRLEHSLISLSKWESIWHKPFLHTDDMTVEETLDYIRCMTITQNVDPIIYRCLSAENIKEINEYIYNPMTATTINIIESGPKQREKLTSEVIYYDMISCGIPFECEKWHLNRLIMLIRVCSVKNQPQRKMSRSEIASRNRALNAARKKQLGTSG